jgi:large subunit ribosomal protein L28
LHLPSQTRRRVDRFPLSAFSDSISVRHISKLVFWSIVMAMACEICGKKPSFGNTISHAHNVTRRRWNPNLRRVRAVIEGVRKQVRVCTSCIRAGKVVKAA